MSEPPAEPPAEARAAQARGGEQAAPPAPGPVSGSVPAQGLRVDASALSSSYCNVCNVNSTREEVVLNFGVNQDWDRAQGGEVRLLHRIILSPYAAKRVSDLLARVIQDYEARHGPLA